MMPKVAKSVQLYKDIQQNPELRKINVEVNQINDMLAKMGRSEYFKGVSLPERFENYTIVQSAKEDYTSVKYRLDTIKSSLNQIWNQRRIKGEIERQTGIVKSGDVFIKTLTILPESAVQRSKRTGRGILSEKAVRILIANDIEMLKRLTHKSEAEIVDFFNSWYEAVEVSGGQTLESFIDGVYKSEYSGSGASQSWGSPTVKGIITDKISEAYEIDIEYDEEIELSWETESKMGTELFEKWMNLFM